MNRSNILVFQKKIIIRSLRPYRRNCHRCSFTKKFPFFLKFLHLFYREIESASINIGISIDKRIAKLTSLSRIYVFVYNRTINSAFLQNVLKIHFE